MNRGPGVYMRNDYGEGECPYCKKTYTKVHIKQIACSKIPCRTAHNNKIRREARARHRAKAKRL